MFGVRETTIQTMLAESHESMANDDRLRAAQLRDGLPVVVLTADSSLVLQPGWDLGQQNLAALSSNSRWVTVPDTGHNIQADQPQSVIDAIRAVWDSATTAVPLS
jgi:pimeloyl-ACP methyl ester carboxylesterase